MERYRTEDSLNNSEQEEIPESSIPKGRRARSLKKVLAIGAVALNNIFPGQLGAKELDKDNNTLKEEVLDVSEKELTVEQKRAAESVLGTELLVEIRKIGFNVNVPLLAEKGGKYLIHIGQRHEYPIKGIDRAMAGDDYSGYQTKVMPFLKHLADRGGGVIFTEGVGYDMSESKKEVLELNKMLLCFDSSDLIFGDIPQLIETLKFYFENKEHSLVRDYIDRNMVDRIVMKAIKFLNSYQTSEKDKDKLELEQGRVETYKESIKSCSSLGKFTLATSGSGTNLNSAVFKLYMAGEVKIAPTETKEANSSALNVLKELQDAGQQLELVRFKKTKNLLNRKKAGLISDDRASAEMEKLENELRQSPEYVRLEKAKEKYEKLVFQNREEIVKRSIKYYEVSNVALPNYVLFFGTAHNFVDQFKGTGTGVIKIEYTEK